MTLDEFRESLQHEPPPGHLSFALVGLWWDAKGRWVGQATGAALYGAILNYGLHRRLPGSTGLVDRLMDPVQRHGLAGGEIERLTTAIAGSLHEVYWVSGVLAVATLLAALRIPLGLKPARGGPAR